ncbi:M23 family metallopeptidase [Turneriella parva]|uniref:Peptidase M23 n=1 Tax=Turneriella parva (strain ATCC BAA-1111 / DSM 21527 / NCTC 11395 / H) TaxID=869212 RepID=I4B5W4_TURPD|nr:M23 family metallopeptidase [Turneriella parva]AFM12671.1 Peptidase M23 [Turneriella parva DSM 21527]
MRIILFTFALTLQFIIMAACKSQQKLEEERNILEVYEYEAEKFHRLLTQIPTFDGFDFPICKPEGAGCYDANPFGTDDHLGEDWNAGPNNKDLGKPIYSIGNGVVVYSRDIGNGWGKVLRVIHRVQTGNSFDYIEALYAHFHKMEPSLGDFLTRGQRIGTIGTAGGSYEAHLHLELRSRIAMPIGGGYSANTAGFLVPKVYIKQHRPKKN